MGAITVHEVLTLPALRGNFVVAGQNGLDRVVTGVNVMEVPDIESFVKSGELLLTTAYPLREHPEELAVLVRTLSQLGLAALAVKTGRYLEKLPDDALAVANELGLPVVLLANKFDLVHRRGDLAPWLRSMQERHPFAEFVPMSANNARDIQRLFGICEPYLPEQAWMHDPEELTDRSERFMASEMVREKLFRLTGDELPYTSTVIIDKFEQEGNLKRIAATIVVERDGHKGMVIGDKGEKLKRIGTEARQELEKIWDCKVFLELWVKVRSGWADDAARVRSFGYE